MTKKEQFKEWLDEQHSAGAIIADKIMREAPEIAEEIWGISGNSSVIPSNLPSEKEFIAKYEVIYGRDLTGVTKASLSILYDWLVSQMGEVSLKESRSGYSRVVGQEMPSEEVTVSASIREEEPAYKEIPFSMEEYKKHPDCLYLRETGTPIKELVHFNSARYSFQYAGTVDGDLYLFMSGNEFILRVPVKRVRKSGWVNAYKQPDYGCDLGAVFLTEEEALNHQRVDKGPCIRTYKIEWTEEE